MIQKFKFVLFGALASLVNVGSRYFLSFGIDFWTSTVIAYFLGAAIGFLTYSRFVFQATQIHFNSALRFVAVNLLGLSLTTVTCYWIFFVTGFSDADKWPALAVHSFAILLVSIVSFLLHKKFTFR